MVARLSGHLISKVGAISEKLWACLPGEAGGIRIIPNRTKSKKILPCRAIFIPEKITMPQRGIIMIKRAQSVPRGSGTQNPTFRPNGGRLLYAICTSQSVYRPQKRPSGRNLRPLRLIIQQRILYIRRRHVSNLNDIALTKQIVLAAYARTISINSLYKHPPWTMRQKFLHYWSSLYNYTEVAKN